MSGSDSDSGSNSSASTVRGIAPAQTRSCYLNDSLEKTTSITHFPNLRRCQSSLPWSTGDITPDFYRRGVHLPYLSDEIKNKEGAGGIRARQERPEGCVYELFKSRTQVETWINTVDVERIVSAMERARAVVPVPGIIDWGQPNNLTFQFLTTARREKLYSLWDIVRRQGEACLDLMWPQIQAIIKQLGLQGLWHSGLFPFFILIDNRWNIRAIRGWDYCTDLRGPLQTTRSFRCMGYSRILPRPNQELFGDPNNWDMPEVRFGSLEYLDLACISVTPTLPSSIRLDANLSRLSKDDIKSAGRGLPVKLEDFADRETQRVVILCGTRYRFISSLTEAIQNGQFIGTRAKVSLIIAEGIWQHQLECPPRIVYLNRIENRLKCSRDDPLLVDMVAETVIGARPDLILLVGWRQPLSRMFWAYNQSLPRVIRHTNFNTPVVRLTDSTMDEFPDDKESTYHFWKKHRRDKQPVQVLLTTILLRLHDSGPVIEKSISMRRHADLKDFRQNLLQEQLRQVHDTLTLTRNPRRAPWIHKDGTDLSKRFQSVKSS